MLYIGIYPQYCIENISTQKKQDPIQSIAGDVKLDQLSQILEWLCKHDIEYTELGIMNCVIAGGRILKPVLREIKRITEEYPLKYTVHCLDEMDMRDVANLEINHDIFRSSLEYTAELGGKVFVAHFSRKSPDSKVEGLFEEGMFKMAEYAKQCGVIIGIENIEIERVDPVVDLVKKLQHDNLKITFDFGHAFLASKLYDFDFLDAVRAANPYIQHTHIHDNIGNYDLARLENKQKSLKSRMPLGKGDMHMPIGWGKIPYKEAFSIIRDSYNGVYMLEDQLSLWYHFLDETLETLKSLI